MGFSFIAAGGFLLGGALSAFVTGSAFGMVPGLMLAGVTLLIAGFRR
jgi:hypothetical protein